MVRQNIRTELIWAFVTSTDENWIPPSECVDMQISFGCRYERITVKCITDMLSNSPFSQPIAFVCVLLCCIEDTTTRNHKDVKSHRFLIAFSCRMVIVATLTGISCSSYWAWRNNSSTEHMIYENHIIPSNAALMKQSTIYQTIKTVHGSSETIGLEPVYQISIEHHLSA